MQGRADATGALIRFSLTPTLERSTMPLIQPPIWHCLPRTPVCRYGHPYVSYRQATMTAEYRVDGHLYLTCTKCQPHTHAWGRITLRPDPLVTLYAIDKQQLDYLLALPDDTDSLEI